MTRYSQPFVPPKAPEILYRNELYRLIKAMAKDYKSVIALYRAKQGQISMDADTWITTDVQAKMKALGKKWGERFAAYAKTHSPKFVDKLLRMSNTQLKSTLKGWLADTQLELVGNVIPTPVKQVVKASVAYNVELITSVAAEYHNRVYGALMRSITGNGSLKDLQTQIYKYGNMSLRRAKLISYDQTRKVYASITLHTAQHYGVQKMQWMHSMADKHPRDMHIRKFDGDYSNYPYVNGLNGLIFDLNAPPVIQRAEGNKPEIRGYPTDLINCTCLMRAVLDA